MKYKKRDWLLREYVKKEKSASRIAKEQGVTPHTVLKYLRKNELEIRKHSFKGTRNPRWKGGRNKDKNGYIYVYSPDHPYKTANNTVFEHRLIMEGFLGRYLLPCEIVHHKNHKKNDNRINNLELMNKADHASLHATENCKNIKRDKKGVFTK